VGKKEKKIQLGRPNNCINNNKMELREIECYGMDWIDLTQDRDKWRTLLNMVINLRVP
jgi:hypothetical protein